MTLSQWKPGLIAAAALALITLLPQICLWYERGGRWSGSYACLDRDEFAYSAYVNALIAGRPRINDPYTGQDGGSFENLFSIQFLPAYAMAVPARILGISAASAFVILLPLVTIASTLILFRLLSELTQDNSLSAIGAFAILCFGWLAASAPWIFFTPHVPFPFLRRYMPAFAFPFLLMLMFCAWRALTRNSAMWAILTGLNLVILIYSYFFLWTAAAAWLVVLMILWLVARPQDRRKTFKVFCVAGAIGLVALVPYVWLVLQRRPLIDEIHLIVEYTRRPDLLRGPEIYGALILLGLIGKDWRLPRNLFTLSFALAPFLVFNQQVVTGRSLQPFHYEQFVANYWALIGLFLAIATRWKAPKRVVAYLVPVGLSLALAYGFIVAVGRLKTNVTVDQGRAAALRLKGNGIVFASNADISNSLAVTASNPVLWSRYLLPFSNVSFQEQKHKFYQHLYYSGTTADELRAALEREHDSARFEIFGVHRGNPLLTTRAQLITTPEIETAIQEYRASLARLAT